MDIFTRFKKMNSGIFIVGIIVMSMLVNSSVQGQSTLRNPVLEFCTGTWCQWCPCGDSTVINQILPAIPNAIILGYHGPANTSSDPFSFFPGNGIISALGLSAYPTGVVDRASGIVNWNTTWVTSMNSRSGVPATVSIEIDRSYNPITRELNATLDFTAMQTLSGEYRYSIILVEDGIVWAQTSNGTCTPGTSTIPNYIHEWLVRDVMTGVAGQVVVNGSWNASQTITKTFNYTIPVPGAPAPDIVPDSCSLVVMVYRQGAPLNSNAEIQQAEKFPLISPNYVAVASAQQTDFLTQSSGSAGSDVVIKNEGLLADKYYISLSFDGPGGWGSSFTTVNGTFGVGDIDSVDVVPGDSAVINVEINPNSINGYGRAELSYWSANSPSTFGDILMRVATFGLDVLVVDDEGEHNYEEYMTTELDKTTLEYGVVSGSAVLSAGADLNTFGAIIWMCANATPTIDPAEMTALGSFLDNGGSLYLSGVDIAYELADPTSPYYTTASLEFFNNYLHANYILRAPTNLHAYGIPNDPISGGINQILLTGGTGAGTINIQKKANQIEAADANAAACFSYFGATTKYCGVRTLHPGTNGTGRVVFTTFGFETIADALLREALAVNILEWISTPTAIGDEGPLAVNRFELKANYPNPFNPSTTISYSLPIIDGSKNVSLVIYNQLGQKVRSLINGVQQPTGAYEVQWNGLDDAGKSVASGIYFYQLRYGDYQANRKMLLVR